MSLSLRLIVCVAVACLAVNGSSEAAAPPSAETLFGPSDLAAIVGNGQLTLGINRSGRLTACRWPSPGYFESIAYATQSRTEPLLGVEPWHGASWALQLEAQLIWMHDDRWSHELVQSSTADSIEIESVLAGHDVRTKQRFAIAQSGHVFTANITVTGTFTTPPHVFWYANFSPSTRLIPHFPVATKDLDDFATFVDPNLNAICHFRPRDPSSQLWRIARTLTQRQDQVEDWRTFPAGCYVVYGTRNETTTFTVGPDQGPTSVANQVSAGTLSDQRSAVGQTASALAIRPSSQDEGYSATVIAAFGTNVIEASQRYFEARDDYVDPIPKPMEAEDSDTDWIMRSTMSTIRTCTDATTGSVVRAPTNTPPLAIDWPRYGVWIAKAHDAAGDHESATRILRFYANNIRTQDRENVPHGSIPAAVYTNGIEAAPEAIIDTEAAGRVLWAIERHGSMLNAGESRAFYTDIWKEVNAVADFLVQWREPGGTAPLYTFDYESMRDRRTTELYVSSYLGVRAANNIANAIAQPRPDWRQAAAELKDALRLHAFLPDGEMAITNPGTLYDTGIIPAAELFDWPSAIRGILRDSGGRLNTVALDQLGKCVLSAWDLPEELRAEIASLLRHQLTGATPDAADAAFAYLIAHRIHTLRVSPPTPIQELSPETI